MDKIGLWGTRAILLGLSIVVVASAIVLAYDWIVPESFSMALEKGALPATIPLIPAFKLSIVLHVIVGVVAGYAKAIIDVAKED